ncbi:MAG: molybdate ABC transporter substrate-binding protein [Planctomycetaceae bacterium]
MKNEPRSGSVNAVWTMPLAAGSAILVLVSLLRLGPPDSAKLRPPLLVFVAAGMRAPVEEIADRYEDEFGVPIQLHFGGSNTLLNQLQVAGGSSPDLFLAADEFYIDRAIELGLASETLPIAVQRPVIAVRKDSRRQIRAMADLLRDDVRVSLAYANQAAIGRVTRKQLQGITTADGTLWQQLEAHVTRTGAFKPTVSDVANDVKLGAVDAAIVWDSTVAMPDYRDELQAVDVPELAAGQSLISVAVLNTSADPGAAVDFARFLADPNHGRKVFEDYGVRPYVAADKVPESSSQ